MAQPNVQREPSMDEILASIRRIIESNEPVIQANIANVLSEPEGFSGHAANDDGEDVPLTVDGSFDNIQNRVEQTYQAPQHDEGADVHFGNRGLPLGESVASKGLSLADVAARVRAASERVIPPRPVGDERDRSTAHSSIGLEKQEMDGYTDYQPQALHIEPVPDQSSSESPSRPSYERAVVAEPSLLSSSSGEQVARSFQDLAFAVESAQRRSFDEIAEEIMRPMLQEWLDDNLPTLVERLVREEIERVARGPRRT